MISHFPTPHPDELLFSLCARYGDRTRYRNKGAISLELFGVKDATATIDLPSRLGYLVNNLPDRHCLLLNRLIDEHTLLPFYAPFLDKARVERLRREMEGVGGGAVHKIASITPSTIRPPSYLRFCPLCIENDRQEYRECYWHRLHQVPGVLVCHRHKSFLENSEVRARNRVNASEYVSAEQAKLRADIRPLDMADPSHQCLLFIAQSAEWLLNQRGLVPGYDALHIYYMESLTSAGLAYDARFVRAAELPKAIRCAYPKTMLASIQCDFDDEKEYSWPFRLVKELRLRKANHPLRHLLLIGLLGQTPQSFLRTLEVFEGESDFILPKFIRTDEPPPDRKAHKALSCQDPAPAAKRRTARLLKAFGLGNYPFGTGPWPCMNVTCQFYRQPVITDCHIARHWDVKPNIVGFFRCECGFTYRRNWSNNSTADQFRFDSIKTYGETWKERLRELWSDLTLSIHKMVPLLGVAHNTVKLQAVMLGLEFPRKGPGSKIARADISRDWRKQAPTRIKHSPSARSTPVDSYRRALLRAIKKHPSATRTRLGKQLASQAYRWLSIHDKVWLEAHLPRPVRRVGSNRKVDWAARDPQLVREVQLAVNRVRSVEGRPVRVTVNRLGREIDKAALLNSKNLSSKIPLTAQLLAETVETHLNFSIRCIRWAVNCYRREDTVPSISSLAKLAGMTMSTTHRPEIRAVINDELESLRNCNDVPEIKAA